MVTGHEIQAAPGTPLEYQAQWQPNPGSGSSFGPPIEIDRSESPLFPVEGADIDGDGDQDLRIGGAWYENLDGAGNYARRSTLNGSFRFPEGSLYAADMDGDGDVDFVSEADTYTRPGSVHRLYLHENTNRGQFAQRRPFAESSIPRTARLIEIADLDGDGDADILVARQGFSALAPAHPIQWLENTGGDIGAVHEIGVRRFTAARAVDMDGDGDLDLLASDFRSTAQRTFGAIDWYENTDGKGAFSAVHNVTTALPLSVSQLETADLDGDGHREVVHHFNGTIFLYRNRTDGTLGPQQTLFAGLRVFAADLDSDNDEDIVVQTAAGWVWYANVDGTGTLGPSRQLPDLYGNTVQPADLDFDGDVDLILPETATWLENLDGRGSFSDVRPIHDQLGTGSERPFRRSPVLLADLDGDADLDLVAKGDRLAQDHPLSAHLVWFKNEAVEPLPGDHDGNGMIGQADLDLVLLNWGRETDPLPDGWLGAPPTGTISQDDLDAVLLNWGKEPPRPL